ncbi:MAG: hypothetical protein NVS3B18_11100 [Candidatus Dormibacteria bacterium]
MKFGRIPLDQADGAILAHTQRLPTRVLKKGTTLDPAGIADLRAAGIGSVIAAQLEPGDVPENEAASRLADALIAPGSLRSWEWSPRPLSPRVPRPLSSSAAASRPPC